MPKFLVEIENSTLNTYRVEAADEDAAKAKALNQYPIANSIEEHESVRVTSVIEEVE